MSPKHFFLLSVLALSDLSATDENAIISKIGAVGVDAFAFSAHGIHTYSSRQVTQHVTAPLRETDSRPLILVGMIKEANEEDPFDASSEKEEGSVLGASLLFAGTAIGAGMLALPAETASSGFVPSISSLFLCWAFTFITSLVTLEASWTVGRDPSKEGSGFLSITRSTLGPFGEVLTAILFWFLLTSIVVAYTSEGGALISEFAQEQLANGATEGILSPKIGSTAFMAFFSSLAIFGTEQVDIVNRVLVAGLVVSFLGLLGIGLPQIDAILLSRADWGNIYPQVISVGILSFGAQNVVPTLLQYLGGDAVRTQKAVLTGSLIPLIMYSRWESVFLGIVPWDPESTGSKMDVVAALATTGGAMVQELVEVFSACAIGSSMAGASVSLVDFFQDAISSRFHGGDDLPVESGLGKRLVAAGVALGPPLAAALALGPDAFLGVLENAGLVGGVSLYGLLPALAVINLRGTKADKGSESMPGRLVGGFPALYMIVAVSAALVVPDIVRLVASLVPSHAHTIQAPLV
jgi:tyrosine-specific transport protein